MSGAGAAAPVRVLLCDDTVEMRALLRWALERGGDLRVAAEAVDGRQALALAASGTFDVVVLDLQMPGPAPGELLRAVSAAAPGVPIVTFSGLEPDLLPPAEARLIALHIPKTTDLALVRRAILDVARERRGR